MLRKFVLLPLCFFLLLFLHAESLADDAEQTIPTEKEYEECTSIAEAIQETIQRTKFDLSSCFTKKNLSPVIDVALNGTTVSASSDSVRIDGTIITITAAGTYRFSGSLDRGQIIVQTPDVGECNLILANASITNDAVAPLTVLSANAVIVTLQGENRLENSSIRCKDNDRTDAAIYAERKLTFAGEGSLILASPSDYGIVGISGRLHTGTERTITADENAAKETWDRWRF